jgi:glycosyltransferase involved in cell wall biosynthesis
VKLVQILHHSISPFGGQYPDSDAIHYDTGLPMKFARAIRARYPQVEIECWRPERTVRQPVTWKTEDGLTHRVFPSRYWRYNFELSLPMMHAIRSAANAAGMGFWVHGSYNLHSYLLAPILKSSPVILQSHGGFPAPALFQRSGHRTRRLAYLPLIPVERLALPQYPRMYAISSEELEYIRRFLPGSTAEFSPTGADFDLFSACDKPLARAACGLPGDQQMILYVGRLSREKGMTHLVDAFHEISPRFRQARLYIVGSGPLRDDLVLQVEKLGLQDRVLFLGHIAHSALPKWYCAADVTAMPSPLEWFGMVAAESLACGTPVVACQAGGAIDIVREFECGVLIPPRDSSALAEALAAILSGAVNTRPNVARGRAAFDWTPKLSRAMAFLAGRMGEKWGKA